MLVGHKDPVKQAAFSPDGKFVVTASDDNTARLWEAAGGNQLHVFDRKAAELQMAALG